MRGWKNIFHANGKQKKAGVPILISDKIDLKIKMITRDKQGHYIMIKGSIQEQDITIVNIYATSLSLFTLMHWRRKWQPTPVFLPGESQGWGSLVGCRLWGHTESNTTEVTQQHQQHALNIEAPQYVIRQTLTDIKGEIDSNTIIVGDFNTPLTPMDRSSKQKFNKETQILNDTSDEMDLIVIFQTFHPNAEKYTFFSSAHGTSSRIDHILSHKSNLSKFKKIEIVSSIFSDHNAIRLDINYRKKKLQKTQICGD